MTVEFNPAQSIAEASARMFAIAGTGDVGTRGPRRSLLALANAVGVDVDSNAVNAIVGQQIARALGADWREPRDFIHYQVTLTGMNHLLKAAAEDLSQLSHAQVVANSRTLERALAAFPGFKPARDKQEAVDRMSDLVGAPRDRLGPGGKEHVVTLRHVAARFAPGILDTQHTKHSIAEGLCRAFAVPWSPEAVSTQGTITKLGLNMILAGAERRAGVASAAWATAEDEGRALVQALAEELPERWDAKRCITWMRENGSTKWFESEWAGWYFEEQVRAILNARYPSPAVGGPRTRFGNTEFDYASSTRVWDAKAHKTLTAVCPPDGAPPKKSSSQLWLNDARAMRDCIDAQGLGFLVVDGMAVVDTSGHFREWLERYGRKHGKKPSGYVSSTGRSRPRNVTWTPLELRAIWVENLAQLEAGIAAGWLDQTKQPDWSTGSARRTRNDKFKGSLAAAGRWEVAHHVWRSSQDLQFRRPRAVNYLPLRPS